MKLVNICVLVAVAAAVSASPTPKPSLSFLDELIPNDIKISDFLEIKRNNYENKLNSGRSDPSLEDNVEEYLKSHDVTFKLPVVDSTVTLGVKNLDNGEVDIKLQFKNGNQVEARKSKLKKIFIPIFVFVLIKAMVLIPLALGILAIKTWNALQLSFVSFVVALAMGVWQLCKKVAGDHAHPHIVAHEPWSAAQFAARSIDANEAQKLAYSAYAQ